MHKVVVLRLGFLDMDHWMYDVSQMLSNYGHPHKSNSSFPLKRQFQWRYHFSTIPPAFFLGTLLFFIPNCTISGSNKNQPSRKNSLSYLWAGVLYNYIPSKGTSISHLGKRDNHLQTYLGWEKQNMYISSQEGFNFDQIPPTWAIYLPRLLFRFIPTPRPGPVLCRHLHRCCAWDKTLEFFHWQAVPYRCT